MIVTLPKKGSLSNCNNWRGITLLSVPGKVLSVLLLNRLKDSVDLKLREHQAGFRSNRSCFEQIFTLRSIIEQCIEFQQPMFLNFVDFRKAFDSIHRESMWKIAAIYGIPQKYIKTIQNIYLNSSSCVRTENGNSEYFNIVTGARQGCILSPFLFLLVIYFIMTKTIDDTRHGIQWNNQQHLTDLDFADDIVLIAKTFSELDDLTRRLSTEGSKVGLKISDEKTKSMHVMSRDNNTLSIQNHQIEDVDEFTYLGSVITTGGGADQDIKQRLGKAMGVFRKLQRIWSMTSISRRIKLQLYNTIVLPTALYASETWKSTAAISKKLDVFHQKCLRRILKITYHDRITNEEVLRIAQSRRLQDIVAERRFKFAGHILRMPVERPAKVAMKWQPPFGKRKRGRPKISWKRTFIKDINSVDKEWENIEQEAADRNVWRQLAALCAEMRGRT